jgi:hypothetical protein
MKVPKMLSRILTRSASKESSTSASIQSPPSLARRVSVAAALLAIVAALPSESHAQLRQSSQTGETQVFGLWGKGSRFVYVFDRSLSMQGQPLAAAKRELLASLSHLERVHQFQIVFYNEAPKLMRLSPAQPAQMIFADEDGLKSAGSFVNNMSASGGTNHVAALKLALRLSPDVIFFLTDADDPVISPKELEQIQRANGGTIIHVVEFKPGPDQHQGDFLRKLAEQNRGQFKYVDTTAISAGR